MFTERVAVSGDVSLLEVCRQIEADERAAKGDAAKEARAARAPQAHESTVKLNLAGASDHRPARAFTPWAVLAS